MGQPPVKIVSIKSFTPPRSGDRYHDAEFGNVKLIKPGGGDSWICETERRTRLYLRPSKMKPIHDE